jgi:uncharacterized membrane protein
MSFRGEFEAQSSEWVRDGVISSEQREAIIARLPDPPEGLLARRLVPGLTILGAVVVVLGLVLMVSANWDEIPRMTKLVTGVILLAGLQGAGYWVGFGPPARRNTGIALMFVGSGIFLANLALITQQYNVEPNPSRLILLAWLLGLAGMPYLAGSRLFALASAGTLMVGLGVEAAREGSPLELGAVAGLLMFVGVGVGVLAYGAGHRLSRYASLAAPIEFAGAGVVLGLLYMLGFYRHYDGGEEVAYEAAWAPWFLIGIPALALLAVVAAWLWRDRPGIEDRSAWSIAAGATATGALLAYVVLVLALANPSGFEEPRRIVWTIGFWLASILLAAIIIWLGAVFRRAWWTNSALAFLGLFVITRYFDTFGSYTQTGVLFAGAGLLLLVVAFVLERSRRFLTTRVERPV